jgi:hypothetical protein
MRGVGILLVLAVLAAGIWLVIERGSSGPAAVPVIPCWESGQGLTVHVTGPAGAVCPDPGTWDGPVPGMPYQQATADIALGLGTPLCSGSAHGAHWTVWATDSSGAAQEFCGLLTS